MYGVWCMHAWLWSRHVWHVAEVCKVCKGEAQAGKACLAHSTNMCDCAQAYGTGLRSGNLLLVSQNGSMVADKATLRKQVPDVFGNYMWTLTPPHGRKARAVYLGKAGGDGIKQTLKGRFEDYLHDKYFGPKTELFKQWAMVDAQSRAFKIEIRFRTDMDNAKSAEEDSLDQYDFALNNQKNGDVRWPITFGQSKKQWEEYPVINKELGELAQALQVKLKIDGKL
mmetsp:Transcript_7308/g.17658  ORF Transcript_7308/g.17658 Transcript_7308/m.17658 type:complete len:225 (-) Transcript_7308:650-1324(-)